MIWGSVISLFLLSTVKFMFAPLGGPGLGLSFFQTYFTCVSGGIVGASFFYFSGGYFIQRAEKKRLTIKKKKTFSRINKLIVKTKKSIGIVGISFWAPFFLSIPVGSIIVAKFYGQNKKAYLLIVIGMFINALITTGLAYLIYG
ncbi:MAG: hypothetical protein P8N52_07000 [Crocinitomicaceae bacterium]|nr:hypothetical protein [Crocinitomicaceae bacterium]MDG1776464.1 hypothetical protein [Crocinitomicaceae bacterium]